MKNIKLILGLKLVILIATPKCIFAQGLEKRANQLGLVGWIYDYNDNSDIPSGWKIVNRMRQPIGFEGKLIGREKYPKIMIFIYRVEYHTKEGILKFNEGIQLVGRNKRVLAQHFNSHANEFDYSKSSLTPTIPYSAKALNSNGKILAKAKLLSFIKDEEDGRPVGIEIEENHIDTKELVIFKAISQYELSTGFKRFENIQFGEKNDEYFPIWPTHR